MWLFGSCVFPAASATKRNVADPKSVSYQNETAKRFSFALLDGRDPLTAQVLAKRPFYVWWFMNQLEMCVQHLLPFLLLSDNFAL